MKNVAVSVDGSLPGELSFDIRSPGGDLRHYSGPVTKLAIEQINADRYHLEELLPPYLIVQLKQSILSDLEPVVLSVASANDALEGIPWESLPEVLEVRRLLVVREFKSKRSVRQRAQTTIRLLAAGWPGKPAFGYVLAGVESELKALSELRATEGVEVEVLYEPSPATLSEACAKFRPDILHLIPLAINHQKAMPELVLSGEEALEVVPTDRFLAGLPKELKPRLVVLNTCSPGRTGGGRSALHVIAERLRTVATGWLGDIEDRSAVEFARFLYARILNGETMIDALIAYGKIQPFKRDLAEGARDLLIRSLEADTPVPVIWTPSVALLAEPLLEVHLVEATFSRRRTRPADTAIPKAQFPSEEIGGASTTNFNFPT